jgi:hypothetical protein
MTEEGAALKDKEAPSTPQCRHHWIIETPHGATSWGVCKVCGAKKEFPNAASDSLYEGDIGSAIGSSNGDWAGRDPSRSYTTSIDMSSPGDDF